MTAPRRGSTSGSRSCRSPGIAFLWFMGVVRDRFKETEDQLFSSVFIGSGLLFLAMVFVVGSDRRRHRGDDRRSSPTRGAAPRWPASGGP